MTLTDYLYYIILPVLVLSVLLALVRFFKGPTINDRIVALDLMITIGIGIIAVYSMTTHQQSFLDIALIFALIAFLSTTAFSFYLEKRKSKEND
jgi:multicomponent Na+:H+ antiporter subunit F